MRRLWLQAELRPLWRSTVPRGMTPGQLPVAASRLSNGTGRIQLVQETNPSRSSAPEEPRRRAPMDESRILMMRREQEMSVEQRIELFERLSRDAAWVRSATRIR